MTTLFQNGPLGVRTTIVVVGDGFGPRDQQAYNQAVDRLLTNGVFARDFFAANRPSFNLLRINLESVDSGVGTRTYNANGTVNQVNRNTALGAFYNGDWAHSWLEDGAETAARLARAVSTWVDEHHLVVVLLNNPGVGGRGGRGRATLAVGETWDTVAHEFGHALGGLGDEYHRRDNWFTRQDEPNEPNLTININRATLKWAADIHATTPIPTGGDDYKFPKPSWWNDTRDVGLFEGGGGDFARGIFRPVVNCRMRSNVPAFCPVCERAMATHLVPRRQIAAVSESGHERTEPAVEAGENDSYLRLLVRMQHGELTIVEAHEVDGPLRQLDTISAGYAHELFLGDRRISVGSHPDVGVDRSFSTIGPEGPRPHRIEQPDAFDFVVRVPTADLRGTDSPHLTLNLISVNAPFTIAADNAFLPDSPPLDASLIATTYTLAAADLPESLRRIIETE